MNGYSDMEMIWVKYGTVQCTLPNYVFLLTAFIWLHKRNCVFKDFQHKDTKRIKKFPSA